MKTRGIIVASSALFFVFFALVNWASGAFLQPGVSIKDGKSTSVALTADSTGVTYAVWVDRREGWPKVYFNRSDDGGATWLPNDLPVVAGQSEADSINDPQVRTDGKDTIYVTWQLVTPSPVRKEIWMTASRDGGRTWPEKATHLPDLGHAFWPQIVADGQGRVATVWYEELKTRSMHGLYIATSADGGKTWGTARRLDSPEPPGLLTGQRLATDRAGRLYVIWWETRARQRWNEVMFFRSDDFGATWPEGPVRLNLVNADAGDPSIVTDGRGHVYVIWDDDRTKQGGVYFRMSSDHGKTWGPEVELEGNKGISRWQRIVLGPDGEVVVAWASWRRDAPGVYAAVSRDRGASWSPARLAGPLPPQWIPMGMQLAADGKGRLAAVWLASERERPTETRLYLSLSSDWGKTWEPPTLLNAISSGPSPSQPGPGMPAPKAGETPPSLTPNPSGLLALQTLIRTFDVVIDQGKIVTVWEEARVGLAMMIQGLTGVLPGDLMVHTTTLDAGRAAVPSSSPATEKPPPN